MKLALYFLLAIENMWRHKLRTALTLLGLVVGIASVLVMTGIGKGFGQMMDEDFSSLLPNKLTLRQGFVQDGPQLSLTLRDAETLRSQIGNSAITSVVPKITVWDISVKGFDPEEQWLNSTATTADYVDTVNWTFQQGRFFTAEEEASQASVAVVNTSLIDYLTQPGQEPPRELTINNQRFSIIGIIEEENNMFGGGFPSLYIPIQLLERKLTSQSVQRQNGSIVVEEIYVMALDMEHMEEAKQDVERTMRLAHNRMPDEPNSFELMAEQEFMQMAENFNQGFTMVLGGIGTISLIVGGIGVMNIMLAAIAERTREVGLRKAIGATNGDILFQFLTEAVAICLTGGALGIGLSYLIALILATLFPDDGDFGIRVVVDFGSIMIAVLSSTLCGILFGTYPALRAMRLRPIEALRYE